MTQACYSPLYCVHCRRRAASGRVSVGMALGVVGDERERETETEKVAAAMAGSSMPYRSELKHFLLLLLPCSIPPNVADKSRAYKKWRRRR